MHIIFTQSFIAFVALLAAANAEVSHHATIKHGHVPVHSHQPAYKPPPPTYHEPVYKPAPSYKPVHKPSYHEPTYEAPPKYIYEYAVADEYAGVNFGQNEARDGYSTYGEYRVVLPDCRTQIVKYSTADGYSGNIMEVTYEGKPCYDTYKPTYKPEPVYKPHVPAYKPAPVYKPAPSYHA